MSVPPFRIPVDAPLHPEAWVRPAGNHEMRVTQGFWHVNTAVSKAIHGGTDMGSGEQPGRKVYAMADGLVIAEGWLLAPWSQASGQWPPAPNYGGIMAVVQYGADYIGAHAHLQRTTVSKGQRVKAGQQIGNVGNTGAAQAFGTHLHTDLYRRLKAGESSPLAPITYAGAQWAKRDLWPLLAQNYTVPDTSTAPPQEDDMRFGGADFHVAPGVPTYRLTDNSNFRSGPGTANPSLGLISAGASVPVSYLIDGETPAGSSSPQWALCFFYINQAYRSGFIHSSLLEPIGDPGDAAAQEAADAFRKRIDTIKGKVKALAADVADD